MRGAYAAHVIGRPGFALLIAATLVAAALRADPLHALEDGAYWHHESGFIFPTTLAQFTRAGAPQELDGSSTVVAYYAHGDGAERVVAEVAVFPVADGRANSHVGEAAFVRTVDHAGWRIVVRASLPGDAARESLDALVRALPSALVAGLVSGQGSGS